MQLCDMIHLQIYRTSRVPPPPPPSLEPAAVALKKTRFSKLSMENKFRSASVTSLVQDTQVFLTLHDLFMALRTALSHSCVDPISHLSLQPLNSPAVLPLTGIVEHDEDTRGGPFAMDKRSLSDHSAVADARSGRPPTIEALA
ncbi:unnamed protein product [Cyclocybe aegerita]|uniref:Uncharacterized protein n=1 Tax=Cyclocybe aegerita TaxID=1973307 RepID=A0A8S0VU92_CYCAE|nr:unnamed protein product [Cyclocybe aegerita]